MNVFSDALKATNGNPLPLHKYVGAGDVDEEDSLVTLERQNIFDAVQHDSMFTLLVSLLLGGVSPNVKRESDGATPLHVAIIHHPSRIIPIALGLKLNVILDVPCTNRLIMGFLLDNGADVDAKAHGDETPLMVAAACHNLRAVRLLLQKGANVEARDRSGRTCLSYAAPYPNVLMTIRDFLGEERFMEIGKREFLLHQVCHRPGCRFAALFLVEQLGFDINYPAQQTSDSGWQTVRDGFTPLHCAVTSGDLLLTKALVSAGADINKPDAFGVSPVELSCNSTVADVRAARDDSFTPGVPINPSGIRKFLLKYRSLSSPTKREELALAEPAPSLFTPLSMAAFVVTATVPHFLMYFASYFTSSFALLFLLMAIILVLAVRMKQADEVGTFKAASVSQRPLRCLGYLIGFIVVEALCLPLYSTLIYYKAFNFQYEQRGYLLFWVVPSAVIMVLTLLYVMVRSPGYVSSSAGQRKGIYTSLMKTLKDNRIPRDLLFSVDWELMIRKPMRAQHCPQINRLVLRYDGFAPLVASSIGANNHRAYIFFQFMMIVVFSGCYHFARSSYNLLDTGIKTATDRSVAGELKLDEYVVVGGLKGLHFSTPYFRFVYMYTQILLPIVLLLLAYNLFRDLLNICSNLTHFDVANGDTHSSLYCFKLKDAVYSLYDRGTLNNLKEFFTGNLAMLSYRPPALSAGLKKKVEDFQKSEILLHSAQNVLEEEEEDGVSGAAPTNPLPKVSHHRETTEDGSVIATTFQVTPDQMQIQALFQEMVMNGGIVKSDCPAGVTAQQWEQYRVQATQMYAFFKKRASGSN